MQVNGSGSVPTSPADRKASTVDYNGFLKMLIAQMKNQDPTSPADPTQFVAQLASFSSVEQALQTNSKLDSLLAVSSLHQAGAAIGQTITSADGLQSGVITAVRMDAPGPVAITQKGDEVALKSGVTLSRP